MAFAWGSPVADSENKQFCVESWDQLASGASVGLSEASSAVWAKPWPGLEQKRGRAAADLHPVHGVGAAGAGHQAGRPAAQHAHCLRPEEGQTKGSCNGDVASLVRLG